LAFDARSRAVERRLVVVLDHLSAPRRSNSVALRTAALTMTRPMKKRLSRTAAAVPNVPYVLVREL
jgi:hypothetical protein